MSWAKSTLSKQYGVRSIMSTRGVDYRVFYSNTRAVRVPSSKVLQLVSTFSKVLSSKSSRFIQNIFTLSAFQSNRVLHLAREH